jgi:4-hydroxy-2-oxoheptanedioate aldolase
MVGTREQAAQVVQWCRYPPDGTRSIGGLFAPYSFRAERSAYIAAANQEIMVIPQIESAEALANLDDIFSVPGIDAAFVGPYDLHMQLGLSPASDSTEPAFVAALEQIKAAARRHHLPLGIYCSGGTTAAARTNQGFQLVSVVSDSSALLAGVRHNLEQARA